MSTPPAPVPEIQKFLGASGAKKVLLVEGRDDSAVYPKWLARLATPQAYETKLNVIDAGGKLRVLRALEWFRDRGGNPDRVVGLVDRDEWDETTVRQRLADLPQLRVNVARHALESYFCDPDEIMLALSNHNAGWAIAAIGLRAQVQQSLSDFVDHWALLTSTDRLKNRMTVEGYPGQFANSIPIPPDADIERRFEQWSAVINARDAFQAFNQLRASARGASSQRQFQQHVWAGMFFSNVVMPAPSGLVSFDTQTSPLDWMANIAEWMPAVPADIAAILQPLLV